MIRPLRSSTIAVLAIALIAGGVLRFAGLAAREMSADEGASWAAASSPTIGAVIRAQTRLNPGKGGLHDVVLHLWIHTFGDGLVAMRALSAAAGTLAIVLLFALTRELIGAPHDEAGGTVASSDRSSPANGYAGGERDLIAALAAILFAVNLVAIKYSREVRMYPLELDAVLAQAFFFMRAADRGAIANYGAVAIFTALALAAHLTAALAFAAEGIWLIWRAAGARIKSPEFDLPRTIALTVAIAAGAAMLAPLAPAIVSSTSHAAAIGAIDWIKPPAPWAAFALFNKATGTFAFPPLALLAVWGAVCGWHRARGGVAFALIWMWAPPLLLLLVSYAIRPAFVERYLVSSFVPFFILAALGIVELRRDSARIPAIAITVALSLAHVAAWERKPHDVQWREAVRVTTANVPAGATIAVAPGYAVNVVRYYLNASSAVQLTHPAISGDDDAEILIIGDQGVAPAAITGLERDYARPLAVLRGVVVRGR